MSWSKVKGQGHQGDKTAFFGPFGGLPCGLCLVKHFSPLVLENIMSHFYHRFVCPLVNSVDYEVVNFPVTSIRKKLFLATVFIHVCNALPDDVVDFTSFSRFHGSILKIDLCRELKRS